MTCKTNNKERKEKKRMKAVRIFNCNTYQIPWFVVQYAKWWRPSYPFDNCTDQVKRIYRLIDALGGKFDICTFQEMFGANHVTLLDWLVLNQYMIPSVYYDTFCPDTGLKGLISNVWNTYLTYRRRTGGLLFACKQSLHTIWHLHLNFTCSNDEESANKSYSITLLDASEYWGLSKYLLLCNVHFHSLDPHVDSVSRSKQREEVKATFIKIHTEQKYPNDFVWANCGVVLVGDFNCAYRKILGDDIAITEDKLIDHKDTTDGYDNLLSMFGPHIILRDLYRDKQMWVDPLLENIFNSLKLYDYTYDGHANSYVNPKTVRDSSRMDYIFVADAIPSLANDIISVLKLKCLDCKILTQPKGEEISDHYPVVASLVPA